MTPGEFLPEHKESCAIFEVFCAALDSMRPGADLTWLRAAWRPQDDRGHGEPVDDPC